MNDDTGGGQRPGGWRRPGRLVGALIPAGLVPAALAGTMLVAACSGRAHPAGSGASPGPGNVQQLDVFAACMRGHGVLNFYFSNSPDTSNSSTELSVMGHHVPGVNPQTAQFSAAMKACKHLLPGGGPGQMTRQQINQQVKFAACMRSHGFPGYPDPIVQNGGIDESPLPSSIDTNSAQFQKAQRTCSSNS